MKFARRGRSLCKEFPKEKLNSSLVTDDLCRQTTHGDDSPQDWALDLNNAEGTSVPGKTRPLLFGCVNVLPSKRHQPTVMEKTPWRKRPNHVLVAYQVVSVTINSTQLQSPWPQLLHSSVIIYLNTASKMDKISFPNGTQKRLHRSNVRNLWQWKKLVPKVDAWFIADQISFDRITRKVSRLPSQQLSPGTSGKKYQNGMHCVSWSSPSFEWKSLW